ncbi:MAG: peptidyl-prolyl cis-trans isomerase [Deltaproteobacteria bacterium]|nr:peptidyl-prolyl cis-trans isomerase [Deltaproteobacteria bacterium]
MSKPAPRRWLREPVVHFLVLGALLFGVDAMLRGGEEEAAEESVVRELVVDAPIRDEVSERLATRLGHDPSDTELEEAIDDWVRTEVLYREGLARGFDEHDPTVRTRVASRMGRVLADAVVIAEPTEDELRAFFDEDPTRWAEQSRIDFTQVFVSGEREDAEAHAEALLATLRAGANPAGMGDTFSGGRRYRRRSVEDLEAAFGPAFVERIEEQSAGEWVLRRSRVGLHLVRIDERSAAEAPDFDAVRADVARAWRLAREEAAVRLRVTELVERWTIVHE